MKFTQMKDWSSTSCYFLNDFDDTAIKVLYDNCVRAGHENMNVMIASIDPESWFMEIIDDLRKNVVMVLKTPQMNLYKILSDGYINCSTHSVESASFNSKEDMVSFLEDKNMYGVSLFSITKTLDVQTLKYSWNLRYCLSFSKEEVRDIKIDYISSDI